MPRCWPPCRLLACLAAAIVVAAGGPRCAAVNIRVDYSQDGSGFFSSTTSHGQQARVAVNAAASFYSEILTDSLAPVSAPPTYFGPQGGIASFYITFASPNAPFTPARNISLSSYSIAQDEYVIFAGGAALAGAELANASLGGARYEYSVTASELPVVEAIFEGFVNSFETRGQSSGFAHWGGAMSFDTDGSTLWSLNAAAPPTAGTYDLYSVAMHEIGHLLGFSRSVMEDLGLVGGADQFVGAAAVDAYGGPAPLQSDGLGGAGGSHWAEGVTSKSVVSGATQEALFDPSFAAATRKHLTLLDAAALADLGWSVALPTVLPGDFNGDHRVDAADYTVWRNGLGIAYSSQDYTTWRQNYGRSATPTAGAPGAPAPAPAGWMVLATAALLAPPIRRRRPRR